MVRANSLLKRVLDDRRMTIAELRRRIEEHGEHVAPTSLYRLTKEDRPLERLDLRVAGILCEVCAVALSELIAFQDDPVATRQLSPAKQARLDELMTRHNDGLLGAAERRELEALVREAEAIALENARDLAARDALVLP